MCTAAAPDGTSHSEAMEFFAWIQFHAKGCQHENLVHMLLCQTRRLPMFLALETSIPGNLLHFLWTLHKGDAENGGHLHYFSERSVYFVAKQVAAGLVCEHPQLDSQSSDTQDVTISFHK
ncbi:hypothetical protein Z043_106265 [Scleropages formosus]|uniref:Serine-threonine/tyrosine-protein kinase catalytic domain-containing protein n=1 Tax=Scleropages formosus TaxID=113540 RepID=A0A0P7VGH5_SCLFO|nr:hypothetical protein Z043_106265 [Scleropages formosus]